MKFVLLFAIFSIVCSVAIADVDVRADNQSTNYDLRDVVSGQRDALRALIDRLQTRWEGSSGIVKNHLARRLATLRDLLDRHGKDETRRKRSLMDIGKKIDETISKLKEKLTLEKIGQKVDERVENLKDLLQNAAQVVKEMSKDIKNGAVEAVQGHADVTKDLVDKVLDRVRGKEY